MTESGDGAAGPPYAEVRHVGSAAGAPDDRVGRRAQRALVVYWDDDRPYAQRWLDGSAGEGLGEPQRPPAGQAPATGAVPPATASVVICTRDRPEELRRCLDGLRHQTRPPDEVIVVDSASQGTATREVALAAAARYVRQDRPGLDVARNAGLLAAGSEVVAFTDDDTELHPRWLERLVSAFDEDHVLAVTGLVLPARLDTRAQWLFERHWGFGRGHRRVDFGPEFYAATRAEGCPVWDIGAGANMAFRRRVVDAVGLFDERLDVGAAGCCGDSEYWYRLLWRGWTCRYEPSAVVFHHHRRTDEALGAQIRAYMRGHTAALLVQFERTRDRGNLRRAFVVLPRYYLAGALGAVLGRREEERELLGDEVAGAAAGVWYYLRHRRGGSRA